MIKNFVDNILLEPDYVLENKYDNFILSMGTESYLNMVINDKTHIDAYIANPNDPTNSKAVHISIFGLKPCAVADNIVKFSSVLVEYNEKCNSSRFKGTEAKYYLYNKKNDAINAGKKMQIAKQILNVNIDEYKNIINNECKNIFDNISDAIVSNNIYDIFLNKTKDLKKYSDIVNNLKNRIANIISDINKPNNDTDVCKSKNTNTDDFMLYKQLTDEYAVSIKQRKNSYKSSYSVIIFNLCLGSSKKYYVTNEMFDNAYNVLIGDGDGQAKYNSIIDIIGDLKPLDYKYDYLNKNKSKCECNNHCNNTKNNMHKRKFNIGDTVIIKKTGMKGIVQDICTIEYPSCKKLKYTIMNMNNMKKYSFFSNELEKNKY